jgi:leucyl aminopeptidase
MKIIRKSPKIDDANITQIKLVDDSVLDLLHEKLLEKNGFKGKYKQFIYLPEANKIFVGTHFKPFTKNVDPYYGVDYYELGAMVVGKTEDYKINEFRITSCGESSHDVQLFLQGMAQRAWNFDTYLPKDKAKSREITVHLSDALSDKISEDEEKLLQAINKGAITTRSIVEDGPEAINPTSIKTIIKDTFGSYSQASVKFIEVKELDKLGMEGITFVGRASRHDAVMSHVVLKPKGEVKKRICLVGKGVTYDSGGLSIKTGGHMVTMKMDMAGAATMMGVLTSVCENGALDHTEVHWISAFVENLIDGSAYKPDDVMTTSSGITIEILNTDAEGRLTLSDALTYATLQDPDYIIDAATLTGAAIRSESEYYTCLMSNDGELANSLLDSFEEEREKTVYTPLPEVLRDKLKGRISDLKNIASEPAAGHKTAGLFLSHFVDQNLFTRQKELGIKEPKAYPWVHLDIAGSAYNKSNNQLGTEGATGQSVRSLTKWILKIDKE